MLLKVSLSAADDCTVPPASSGKRRAGTELAGNTGIQSLEWVLLGVKDLFSVNNSRLLFSISLVSGKTQLYKTLF